MGRCWCPTSLWQCVLVVQRSEWDAAGLQQACGSVCWRCRDLSGTRLVSNKPVGVCWWCRDLSGTRLVSNKPVAVFGGNNDVTNGLLPSAGHVVEQLPPTDYWGYTFYLLPLPGFESFTYKMMTADAPNLVQLSTRTASLPSVMLDHAGDFETSTSNQSVRRCGMCTFI